MKAKKIRKGIGIFFLILLLLVIVLVIVLNVIGSKNKKVMYEMIADGLSRVQEDYTVTQLDAGEYTDMRFYGIMKFHVDQYRVEELGNLSVMTADMGFMQMVSFMITPTEKNVPLCTLDFMYILNNRKSYVEFYDLAGDTGSAEYSAVQAALQGLVDRWRDVEELAVEPHWYDTYLKVFMHKQLKKDDEARNSQLFADALDTYLAETERLEKSSDEIVRRQIGFTKVYSDGLIEKGGVSTDVFKKALGEDKTRDFFDRVFFGTALYRGN